MNTMQFVGRIHMPEAVLKEFCSRNHIRRLALFGSVIREDFTSESDVDVLIEFQPGYTPGYAFIRIQEDLGGVFGRPVDLNTPASLSPYFRETIMREAVPIHDAA